MIIFFAIAITPVPVLQANVLILMYIIFLRFF